MKKLRTDIISFEFKLARVMSNELRFSKLHRCCFLRNGCCHSDEVQELRCSFSRPSTLQVSNPIGKKLRGSLVVRLRACSRIAWGPTVRDFGSGQGGEADASPQRTIIAEPTQAADSDLHSSLHAVDISPLPLQDHFDRQRGWPRLSHP